MVTGSARDEVMDTADMIGVHDQHGWLWQTPQDGQGAEGFGLSMVADPDQTPSIMCPPAAPGAAKVWTLIPLLGTSAARSVISPGERAGDRVPRPHLRLPLRNQDRRRFPRAPGRFPFLL